METSEKIVRARNEINQHYKLPIKLNQSGYEPDWTQLYPILKQYEEEVDCAHYYKVFDNILDELQNRYHYTVENAMLVAKELLTKTYRRRN